MDSGKVEPSAAPSKRIAPRQIKHIEGMRAVAALVVYVNHAYAQAFLVNPDPRHPGGLLSIAGYAMVGGHLAVTVFIAISGFCLTLPVVASDDRLRGGAIAFFKRRARRTLPAYYGSLALALVLIWTIIGEPTGTLWDVPIGVTPAAILSHVLMLQDFFGTSKISYVLWSIAVEWHIYLLFPLLVWGWRRFGPARTVTAALLAGYALRLGFESTRVVRSNPHFLGIFTLGMLAAYVARSHSDRYERLRLKFPWALTGGTAVTLASVLIVVWGIDVAVEHFAVLDLLVGVTAASLLVLSSRSEGNVLSRVFSWKPIVIIGTFSYSVYLLHAPLLQVLWQYAFRPANVGQRAMFVLLMTVGLALVLLVAYWFYRIFEEPFMRPPTSARQPNTPTVPAPIRVGVA